MRLKDDATRCDSLPQWVEELEQRGGRSVAFGHTIIREASSEGDPGKPVYDILKISFHGGVNERPVDAEANDRERHIARILRIGEALPRQLPRRGLELILDRDYFDAVVREHFSEETPAALGVTYLLSTPHGRGLYEIAESLCRMIEVKADVISQCCVEMALIHAISLAPPMQLEPKYRGDTWGPSMLRVDAATRFLASHVEQPFDLAATAKAAGCGMRTLEDAFHRYLGMTPSQFHRASRLEAAFDVLAGGNTSVTEVAIRFGFENLGRFARAYEVRFGCKPSKTPRENLRGQGRRVLSV